MTQITAFPHILVLTRALRVSKEKVAKFKEKIREITRRNRSRRLGETIEELNAYIRGWGNYYKLAAIQKKAEKLDGWVRRKLRVIKLKQSKRVYTIACFLRDEGVREDHAFMVAGSGKGGWRLSKTRESHRAMG